MTLNKVLSLIMNNLYEEAMNVVAKSFQILERSIEAPVRVTKNGGIIYRYRKSTIYVAILLKLARAITGLKAIYHLNNIGLLQEQAALQRVSDELTEDISFLTLAIIFDDKTDLHSKFLEAFFEEELEEGKSAMESAQKRPMIPRKKIQAYINKERGTGDDPSTGKEASRTLSKAYSGYVHAAAPQVMELYFGDPPGFHINGAISSPLYQDHVDDLINYFYRTVIATGFAAKAFGNEVLFQKVFEYSKEFAKKSGRESHLTSYTT